MGKPPVLDAAEARLQARRGAARRGDPLAGEIAILLTGPPSCARGRGQAAARSRGAAGGQPDLHACHVSGDAVKALLLILVHNYRC
jgi:hypothetical protein